MAASQDQCTPKKTGSPARFKGIKRGPSRFKQRDVARALRAANLAGGVERVELTPAGNINIILAGDSPAQVGNELDEWMAKKRDQA